MLPGLWAKESLQKQEPPSRSPAVPQPLDPRRPPPHPEAPRRAERPGLRSLGNRRVFYSQREATESVVCTHLYKAVGAPRKTHPGEEPALATPPSCPGEPPERALWREGAFRRKP